MTSRVHIFEGKWNCQRILSGKKVDQISPYLTEGEEWSPKKLQENNSLAFIGSFVNGMGFILSENEAQHMLKTDSKNADVIFPYLNGTDLNSSPTQNPSRYVINFWDWP